MAIQPEWEEWAAGQATEVGAAVRDFSPPIESSSKLAIDDSAFRAIRHADPRAVVEAFLSAVKRADSHMLRRLMSHRCLATCDSDGLELTIPQPSPVAECRVFHAEYLPNNRRAAHVRCLWSDAQSTRDFIFVLRYEAEQVVREAAEENVASTTRNLSEPAVWRIAGLAVPGSHGTEIFDLESSADLRSLVTQ